MKKVLNPDYKMTFGKAVNRFWSRYFDFSGRATRAEFFFALLFAAIVSFCGSGLFAVGVFFDLAAIGMVGSLCEVAMVFSLFPLTARRLHDTNKSCAAYVVWFSVGDAAMLLIAAYLTNFFHDGSSAALEVVIITLFVILAIASIYLLAAVLSDTIPGKNEYGDSEKYPEDLQPAHSAHSADKSSEFSLFRVASAIWKALARVAFIVTAIWKLYLGG